MPEGVTIIFRACTRKKSKSKQFSYSHVIYRSYDNDVTKTRDVLLSIMPVTFGILNFRPINSPALSG